MKFPGIREIIRRWQTFAKDDAVLISTTESFDALVEKARSLCGAAEPATTITATTASYKSATSEVA